MFASAGYFKGLQCPFFLSGLCERPYCHFKHSKSDEGKQHLQRSTSNSGYVESLSDKPWSVTTTKDKNEDVKDTTSNSNSSAVLDNQNKEIIGYNKYTGDPIYEEFKHETYKVEIPSAITGTSKPGDEGKVQVSFNKYTGEPVYSGIKDTHSNVPEYKPTPIEELKKQQKLEPDNLYDPEKNFSTKTITESHLLSVKKLHDDNQYDPEKNFSTKAITASHSLPFAPKRLISYEPTKIIPKKVAQKTSYEFDISKFSDSDEDNSKNDDEEEEYSPETVGTMFSNTDKTVNSKSSENISDSANSDSVEKSSQIGDENNFMKNVKYFENLLLSDPKKSTFEIIQKNKMIESEVNNSEDKNNSNTNGELKRKDKIVSHCLKEKSECDEDNKLKNKSAERKKEVISSKHSQSKSRTNKHSNSNKSDKIDPDDSKRKSSSHNSSKSHHNSDSHKKETDSSKHKKEKSSSSDSHRSRHSSHKSSSSSKDSEKTKPLDKKDSSKFNLKDSSKTTGNETKDSTKSDHKSSSKSKKSSRSSHSSHNSSHDKKHSSNSGSASKNRSDSQRSSHDKKHSSVSLGHSSKSSFSGNHHRENGISSKIKDKRTSTDSDSKKQIVDINVDLFGEDSDIEMLDDSDIESHPLIQESDLSDADPYDECLQIFKEQQQTKSKMKKSFKKASPEKKIEEPVVVGKRRVAHHSSTEVKRKIPEKPYTKLSPAQVMHNRFLEMRKKALEEAAKLHSGQPSTLNVPSSSLTNNKSRVAHRPVSSAEGKPEKTTICSASKTEKRKARTPNVTNLARPQIPAEFGSKVPTNIRQRYLNSIIDECVKLYDDEEEAYKRGQEEEMTVYKRSNTKTIYLNVAINAIKRLRNEVNENSPSTSKQPKLMGVMKLSHEAVLGGKNATKASYTIKRSGNSAKIIENFKGTELYKRLSKYILTEEQLKENGFPVANPDQPGSAMINTDNNYKKNDRLHEKICVRCGKKFVVYLTGKYAKQEECIYHWAKAWKRKVNGLFDSRYNCCQGDSNSEGCQVAKYHVHETNKWENMSGYMKTLPCSPPMDGDYGVFAMDCEMVYTTAGQELARVTVCDQDNTAVYETLVKPDAEVVDLNTRFSGITEDDLEGVTTTLRDVQAVLLSLFTDKTILIGHSLESDLMAVKIIHPTVVDTSVVFPHRLGPPYKRALRTLMAEYLQKIIQDDVGGHDSMEDAVSCMELMHMKLKEDARKENR